MGNRTEVNKVNSLFLVDCYYKYLGKGYTQFRNFFMKYIYPISVILLSSYQLCFSNTLSVGNATYTVPEDWTRSQFAFRAESYNASQEIYFLLGTGYPFRADFFEP